MYNPQLETFIRVVEAGSFSKAAGEAFITPTAVIKQINLLEEKLGVQLFIRTHRGLTLTASGRSLYQDAKYIIQYSTDSVTRARSAMQQTESIIRVGTSPITPGEFMIELWPSIQAHCPDIKIQLVPYENTPENAREILKNLGRNIDIVAGLFDEEIGRNRGCRALELEKMPIRAAVSIHNPLAKKDTLTLEDMYGEQLMLIRRGWNVYVDMLRDEIWKNHQEIEVVDFDFYNLGVFNQCENSNHLLMAVDSWTNVHPLLKIMPVDWNFTVPSGILYSPLPSETVEKFINAVRIALELKDG